MVVIRPDGFGPYGEVQVTERPDDSSRGAAGPSDPPMIGEVSLELTNRTTAGGSLELTSHRARTSRRLVESAQIRARDGDGRAARYRGGRLSTSGRAPPHGDTAINTKQPRSRLATVHAHGRSSEGGFLTGVAHTPLDRPPTQAQVAPLVHDRDHPNDLDLGELVRGDYSDAA